MPPTNTVLRKPQATDTLEISGSPIGREPEFSWRVVRLLNVSRLIVGPLLILLHFLSDVPRFVGGVSPELFYLSAAAYSGFALINGIFVARRRPNFLLQIYMQVAIDIVAIVTLMHASGGINSGLGNLLIVSIGAVSLTVPRKLAILFAALATIAVLFEQSLAQLTGITTEAEYTPAAVLGTIIFVIALAFQPLARRIRESEALAAQRGVDLANLAELNEYIIQHLRESIVVVDSRDRIRLINESAARYLGAPGNAHGRDLRDVSPQLKEATQHWRKSRNVIHYSSPTLIAADGSTVLNPQFATIGKESPAAVLIFLEDPSLITERVQQTKLASLGRLSASIAHEIRNPVGAISHAGQLLAESAAVGPDQRRLTDIIYTNSERISNIVDNILQLSRRDKSSPERFGLIEWTNEFADEFCRTLQLEEGQLQIHSGSDSIEVMMDPSHMQQIMWNLCENAVRHAGSGQDESSLELRGGRLAPSGRPFLEVVDRGPGIDPTAAERIFEPFFTGGAGGTGLGLFISRELCELNRATLLYEPREDGGSIFRIVFSDPQRWEV